MDLPKVLESNLVRLKELDLDENWLQEYLAKNPKILGLGEDLALVQRERRQMRAGRLDLLFSDGEGDTRYVVEVMLGAIDESHIIRAIEYWDIERRRYPAYDHIAVLVAEDITSRFINVLSLFSGTIPLVVMQLSTIKVDSGIVLLPLKILDQRALREDDVADVSAPPSDRAYWKNKSTDEAMAVVDELLGYINEEAKPTRYELKYLTQYIGVSSGRRGNIAYIRPQKSKIRIGTYVNDAHAVQASLEAAGISVEVSGSYVTADYVNYKDTKAKEAIRSMLKVAVKDQAAE